MKFWKISYGVAFFFLLIGVVKHFLPDTSYNKVSDYIYAQDNISDNEINQVATYISYMPPVIRNKFTDGDWKVYITNDIESKVVGRTVIEDKIVYIKTGFVNQELLHEFFHIYLYEHPFADDFKNIYEEEAEQMMKAYYGDDSKYKYSDITEFYCSAANVVYWIKEDTSGVAPKSFAYFTDLFNKLYSEEQ